MEPRVDRKGLRVYFTDMSPAHPRTINYGWRCMGCNTISVRFESLACPNCGGIQWQCIREAQLPEEGAEVLGRFGALKMMQGITRSQRPCLVSTCGGLMQAWLRKYERGHRLIFKCSRCEVELEPGETVAVTAEPSTAEEALA